MDAILKQDDADESLQRYKAQLLGAAAKGDRAGTRVEINDAVDNVASMAWGARNVVSAQAERGHRAVSNSPADQVFHLDTRAGKDHLKTGVAVKRAPSTSSACPSACSTRSCRA